MKIVNNSKIPVLICVLMAAMAGAVWAQSPVSGALPPAPVTPQSGSAIPSTSPAALAPSPAVAASPAMQAPATASPAAGQTQPALAGTGFLHSAAGGTASSGASSAGAAVSPGTMTAKGSKTDFDDIIKRLRDGAGSGGTTTLGDIAAAQDALARLDLLLDMEKKLGELQKEHNSRVGASEEEPSRTMVPSSLPVSSAPAIAPVSAAAFGLPPGMGALSEAMPVSGASMGRGSRFSSAMSAADFHEDTNYTIDRIIGGNGEMRAFINGGADGEQSVVVGDKLDSWKVESIGISGVSLQNSKGKTKFLPVKIDGIPVTDSRVSVEQDQ